MNYPTPPLGSELSPVQRELLTLLHTYRFATTEQLARLTRPQYISRRSALRQSQRHLASLEERHLVTQLERRIGGWQKGSAVGIWALTTSGLRELTGASKRLRPRDISTSFLGHHLAITETATRFLEAARELDGYEVRLEIEPASHRPFMNRLGVMSAVKPDLAATVHSPDFTDYYFIEVDRDTENPARIIRTMRRYGQYLATETEQDQLGVFPAVVWIVPSLKRRCSLARRLKQEPDLPSDLWMVIELENIPALVKHGPVDFLGREPG
ncbi:replication-relaxation family protein [Corynebacterium cystitidis]|uniref:replication-relaxation family protein n=1 Tax=Corynebacterium cystitidis TaxID=35757 RepID=UPI00211F1230|nr:replication-relaxation family protein [Corynebacterium cystitidis]